MLEKTRINYENEIFLSNAHEELADDRDRAKNLPLARIVDVLD